MADVKLPLNIRKELRDSEAKRTELLQQASTAVGSTVTMDMALEQTYAALASNSDAQKQVVAYMLAYLEQVVAALKKAYSDALVKADLESAWSSHKIAVLAVPDDQWDAVCNDASTTGTRYGRLRIKNGELQSVNPAGYFGSYTSDVAGFDLTPIAVEGAQQSTPGSTSLPLPVRKELRDAEPKMQSAMSRIHALKGLEDAKLDTETTAQKCVAAVPKEFKGEHLADYMEKLADLLTKTWSDDMTSEALLDEWKAPHAIELLPELDLWTVQGSKMVKSSNFNALRLEGGRLQLLAGQGYWHCYISDIPNLDISSIL